MTANLLDLVVRHRGVHEVAHAVLRCQVCRCNWPCPVYSAASR